MSLEKKIKIRETESYNVQFMSGDVKHRALADHLLCTYHTQCILGVKETPVFSSMIFMAGDHRMEKISSKVSR